MKRIGILGGTFNPVHIGHLTIAQVVEEQLNLDKVLFVPSYQPPHKSDENVISAPHRYRMVKLAIAGKPKFAALDYEIKKKGKSYSIDTIIFLKKRYPKGTKFYFIIGGDMVPTLPAWKRIDDILKVVSFVAVSRAGYKRRPSKIQVKAVEMQDLGVSSTYLRRRIAGGKSIRYLVPDNVLRYIKKHKLYQPKAK